MADEASPQTNTSVLGDDVSFAKAIFTPVRNTAEEYGYPVQIKGTGAFRKTGTEKTYLLYITGDRESGYAATGDSNDAYMRVSGNNYAANDSNFILRGTNVGVNNRSGGTLGQLEAGSFGAQNKSGGTAPTVRGLTVTPENYGTCATEFGGIDIVLKNEGAAATTQYGLRIRNLDNSTANAVTSAISVTDTGTNTGFNYILDAYGATISTAAIRFGKTSTEDIVIVTGDFADAGDSGFAPGSIGLDTTNGLLFVSDTNGVWQQVGLA
jgi:hypothetical protein